MAPPSRSPSVPWARAAPGLLLVLTALAYVGVLSAGFAWDDHNLVVDNPLLSAPVDLGTLLRADLWTAARGEPSGYFRPLVLLSFLLDRTLAPGSAAWAHLHSLAWHLAATAAVLGLLRQLLPAPAALVAAALFALHPVQSEAVVWIAARNDLMAVALGAAGTALLLRERRLVGALVLVGALLSKEGAVAWLLLAPALRLQRDGRSSAARDGLAVGAAGLSWLLLRSLSEVQAVPMQLDGLTAGRAGLALATWARLLLAPVPLSASRHLDYLAVGETELLAAVLVLVCAGLLLWRGRALAALGLAFAALSLAPALLVATTSQDLVSERYLYQPMVGLALALGAALRGLPARRLLPTLGLALPAVLLIATRVPDWQDDLALYRADHAATPSPYTASQLGLALVGAHEAAAGRALLVEALEGDPPHCDGAVGLMTLDAAGRDRERLAEAVALVQQAGCAEGNPVLQSWLTLGLARLGRWQEARAQGERLRGFPGHSAWRAGLAASVLALEGPAAWTTVARELPPEYRPATARILEEAHRDGLAALVRGDSDG